MISFRVQSFLLFLVSCSLAIVQIHRTERIYEIQLQCASIFVLFKNRFPFE